MPESVDPKSKFFFFNIHLRVIIIRSSIGINHINGGGGGGELPILTILMGGGELPILTILMGGGTPYINHINGGGNSLY